LVFGDYGEHISLWAKSAKLKADSVGQVEIADFRWVSRLSRLNSDTIYGGLRTMQNGAVSSTVAEFIDSDCGEIKLTPA
jgi:hypothetical protein